MSHRCYQTRQRPQCPSSCARLSPINRWSLVTCSFCFREVEIPSENGGFPRDSVKYTFVLFRI